MYIYIYYLNGGLMPAITEPPLHQHWSGLGAKQALFSTSKKTGCFHVWPSGAVSTLD